VSIYLSNSRGSLVIDRKFRGIPRLVVTTSCSDTPAGRKQAEAYEKMLAHLAGDGGRRDIVRAIALRELDVRDVAPIYNRGNWRAEMPRPEELARAFPIGPKPGEKRRGKRLGAIGRWLPTYRTSKGTISKSHQDRMWRNFRSLEELKAQARISDLPKLVRCYREICEEKGTHREFQLVRAAVQTFLRSKMGRHRSLLWAEVADIPTLKPGEGKSTKRPGRTFSPAEAREIRRKLSATSPKQGAQWWSLCITGMMPDEYFKRKFAEHEDRTEIVGTKRRVGTGDARGRRWREIPRLGPVVGPFTEHEAFMEALRAIGTMAGGDVRPYDARHTFAHWMKQAGIDSSRRSVYMGHETKTMDELYERPDRVTHFLAMDREALLAYIGPEPEGEGHLTVVRGAVA
jgi:integrase